MPLTGVDYTKCEVPTQLSSEIECWNWSIPYPGNLGGTVVMNPQHWDKVFKLKINICSKYYRSMVFQTCTRVGVVKMTTCTLDLNIMDY